MSGDARALGIWDEAEGEEGAAIGGRPSCVDELSTPYCSTG
jgi:hypothetical protein